MKKLHLKKPKLVKLFALILVITIISCSSKDDGVLVEPEPVIPVAYRLAKISSTDENGTVSTDALSYDSENKLVERLRTSDTGNITTNFTYNTNGKLVAFDDISIAYNALNKIAKVTRTNHYVRDFTYDANDRLDTSKLTQQNDPVYNCSYIYNTQNQIIEIPYTIENNMTSFRHEMSYNSLGDIDTVKLYRTLGLSPEQPYREYNYTSSNFKDPYTALLKQLADNEVYLLFETSMYGENLQKGGYPFKINKNLYSKFIYQNQFSNTVSVTERTYTIENSLVVGNKEVLLNPDGTTNETNYEYEYETYTPL